MVPSEWKEGYLIKLPKKDWVMNTSTAQKRNGIQWTLWTQLDDLDFADDLALLSHTQQQMQEKTNTVAVNSVRLGLNIHKGKSKFLKVNTDNVTPITLEGGVLEEVESFTYLGSIVDKQGGTDADVKVRIGKARVAFHQMKNVGGSSDLTNNIKIRIFNSKVKPVWLYGAETWRTTVTAMKRTQTFTNTCLRRILRIRWPDIISNQELWQGTRQQPVEEDAGDGLVTLFACLHLAPQDMPSFGIHKGKGKEAEQETPGAVTWRQM
ncbi:hypothetical protein SKAU_G00410980 [Synaphobranchus kaupii]|uniref:DUF6451 domain-containing protein n=1 Tax=Synaphobranchus kaupii TaxID=118154 RepID=A0A9Q1IBP7_SYNKA|nr:hypothetical protein SKAU_G00410980 [Synaphobranchus kaupii]